MKPRSPGRPPLPRGQAATERIEFRVTPAQRKEWTAAAERAGLTLKAWIVQCLRERER